MERDRRAHAWGRVLALAAALAGWASLAGEAEAAPRARELGVPFQGRPGPLDAITDVSGVEVGQKTLICDPPRCAHTARTGVTIIHPLGRDGRGAVAAGFTTINGTGEFTGVHMLQELGLFFGPIALTGTGNVSVVHQALVDWSERPGFLPPDEALLRSLPLVGETLDDPLNDVFAHPMAETDVREALETAQGGPVAEGDVGGGAGMVAYEFKGGVGTASRVVSAGGRRFTVGVLLQSNHGRRRDLRIAGVPVGEAIPDLMPEGPAPERPPGAQGKNSILVVVATDAPLQAHQLDRLSRRVALGLGRNGGTASDLSGEFALAFSTTFRVPISGPPTPPFLISDTDEATLNALFAAAVQATEEAEVNQLVASRTMTGARGSKVYGLPVDRLLATLRSHTAIGAHRAP